MTHFFLDLLSNLFPFGFKLGFKPVTGAGKSFSHTFPPFLAYSFGSKAVLCGLTCWWQQWIYLWTVCASLETVCYNWMDLETVQKSEEVHSTSSSVWCKMSLMAAFVMTTLWGIMFPKCKASREWVLACSMTTFGLTGWKKYVIVTTMATYAEMFDVSLRCKKTNNYLLL